MAETRIRHSRVTDDGNQVDQEGAPRIHSGRLSDFQSVTVFCHMGVKYISTFLLPLFYGEEGILLLSLSCRQGMSRAYVHLP